MARDTLRGMGQPGTEGQVVIVSERQGINEEYGPVCVEHMLHVDHWGTCCCGCIMTVLGGAGY